jgi:hypothetical protein
MMCQIYINAAEKLSETSSQFLQPAIIAAIIAALVAIPSVFLNFRSLKLQRLQSERNEIYKKLNDFYGPMRLHLKNSKELYDLFSKSLTDRLNLKEKFRTLPYLLNDGTFSITEKALLNQIIVIGKGMERIIEKNAGLIDDDNLHKEMIKLSTHIRIIRMAYKGEFEKGQGNEELFKDKTFPNEITSKFDSKFFELKYQLDELNKKSTKVNRNNKLTKY